MYLPFLTRTSERNFSQFKASIKTQTLRAITNYIKYSKVCVTPVFVKNRIESSAEKLSTFGIISFILLSKQFLNQFDDSQLYASIKSYHNMYRLLKEFNFINPNTNIPRQKILRNELEIQMSSR